MLRPVSILLLVFLLVTAVTSIRQIEPGQRGVVRRWGRIMPTKPGPGLYFGLPFGIDRVDVVPVGRVRQVRVGFDPNFRDEAMPQGQMLTGDHNLVNVQAEVHYRVVEDEVERFLVNQERVDPLVSRLAESVLSEWIASRGVDDVLVFQKGQLPHFLRSELQERILPYHLGIAIEDASLTWLNPPTEVKEAFDLVGQAQTKQETSRNEAQRKANSRLSDAKNEANKILEKARGYVTEVELQAQADVERFRDRFRQYSSVADGPAFVKATWLAEMTRVLSKMKEKGRLDVIDSNIGTDGFNLLQFPPPSTTR